MSIILGGADDGFSHGGGSECICGSLFKIGCCKQFHCGKVAARDFQLERVSHSIMNCISECEQLYVYQCSIFGRATMQKQIYCTSCKQWVLTEAEAAAKAIQHRSDRGEIVEKSSGNCTDAPSTSNSLAGPSSAPSLGNRSSRDHSVTHARETSPRENEKASYERNAKRLASAEFFPDGTRRIAYLDLGGDGQSNPRTSSSTQSGSFASVLPLVVDQGSLHLVPTKTVTTLLGKLEGIRQLISNSQDIGEVRQLLAVLEECVHAIDVTRKIV